MPGLSVANQRGQARLPNPEIIEVEFGVLDCHAFKTRLIGQ